jgi:ABC-type bacteriocin/lantibiotic exporter with double-glycine peptidase domain
VLEPSDKKKIMIVIVVQILLGALDLVGVGLIGVIGSLAVAGVGAKPPGDRVQWLLNLLQLETFSLQKQTAFLGLMAVLILTGKTVLSMIILRKSLFFLSNKAANLSSVLVTRLLQQPLLVIQQKSNHEILYSLTTGVISIFVGILGTLIALISDVSLLLVMAIGLFLLDPSLALSTFLLFTTIALILYRILKVRARILGESTVAANISSNSLILEVLASYRELTVKNRRSYYSKRIGGLRHQLSRATAELAFMPNISKYVIEITVIFGCMIISAVQFLTQNAGHAVATLSVFFAASTRIAPAVLRVQQGSLGIKANAAAANSALLMVEKFGLVVQSDPIEHDIHFTHSDFNPEIRIEKVSLKYPGKPFNALENISLLIRPGEVVALVGSSGAGKTSLVDVILGVLKPDVGSVLISGEEPLDAIQRWSGAIGYMPQDVLISNGTIRENIMLGYEPELKYESWVMKAVATAQLSTLISELPNGLDQQLGDRGATVSGGQRQRIGIARAIFTRPKLLVLDEATSALDGETEANVSSALHSLRGSVTVIMIAHRLSTVLSADRVIYMDRGRIIAQGSFEEVRKMVPDFDSQAQLMGL